MYMSFVELCKKLTKMKKCACGLCLAGNEYLCTYNIVREYVGDDKNKLLKLKAECAKEKFGEFLALIVAVLALYISAIQYLTSMYDLSNIIWLKNVVLLVLVVLVIWAIYMIEKFNCVLKWRSYIAVAIEEVEKELIS